MQWSPEAVLGARFARLSTYSVEDVESSVKLDSMENPYGLPENLKAEVAEVVSGLALNRYPPQGSQALIPLLKTLFFPQHSAVDVLLGNGSDEIIQLLMQAFLSSERPVLFVEPSFSMYRVIANALGVPTVSVSLKQDFSLDMAALLQAIQKHQPSLCLLASPNNPTGNIFSAADIQTVIEKMPGVVVLDEAYCAFSATDWLSKLPNYPNLMVMRTVSKIGLAGIRLGFLVASCAWVKALNRYRLPYNINMLTQAVAVTVLKRYDLLQQQIDQICRDRGRLANALSDLGFEVLPSEANFMLIKVNGPQHLSHWLACRSIRIKNVDPMHPLLRGCVRVSVGSEIENETFLAKMKAYRLSDDSVFEEKNSIE